MYMYNVCVDQDFFWEGGGGNSSPLPLSLLKAPSPLWCIIKAMAQATYLETISKEPKIQESSALHTISRLH